MMLVGKISLLTEHIGYAVLSATLLMLRHLLRRRNSLFLASVMGRVLILFVQSRRLLIVLRS